MLCVLFRMSLLRHLQSLGGRVMDGNRLVVSLVQTNAVPGFLEEMWMRRQDQRLCDVPVVSASCVSIPTSAAASGEWIDLTRFSDARRPILWRLLSAGMRSRSGWR